MELEVGKNYPKFHDVIDGRPISRNMGETFVRGENGGEKRWFQDTTSPQSVQELEEGDVTIIIRHFCGEVFFSNVYE